jgi:predicted RNA binding protein YcfA (HicA-like mRNA interferase family)
MKLPRDVSGDDLARALEHFGYEVVRTTGSHMRLRTYRNGEHYVTIPRHPTLYVGTLASILRDVCDHLKINKEEIIRYL